MADGLSCNTKYNNCNGAGWTLLALPHLKLSRDAGFSWWVLVTNFDKGLLQSGDLVVKGLCAVVHTSVCLAARRIRTAAVCWALCDWKEQAYK